MTAADGASSISVTVRVRPFTIREAAQLSKCDDGPLFLGEGSLAAAPTPKPSQKGIRSVIKVVDEKCLVFDPPEDNPVQKLTRSVVPQGKRVKDQTFAFDRVFDENTSQADVYEATTKGLLDSVLEGYNATVFAYGATGCGKTHTITGTSQQPGIIFLTMQELFERIDELQGEKVTEISLSYLEIYNETIRDLLVPGGSKQGLMLREDAHQAVSVAGLSSHHPKDVQEVMDMIVRGNDYRTMSPTEANATSSRSHAVLQINVSSKDRNADVNEPHTMATLSIIDLAGSERASATKNRGERLIEGANINKSLLALGSCINALCDPRKRNHVPYRNSKLTRLLKFSLGGNCKTVMIVCISPSSVHFDETQNTLRYANRAKNIQTKVTRNVFNVNRHVKDYLKKIDEQRALIEELKQQQKEHEANAFVKFKKHSEKREVMAKDGIMRIRGAYEFSATERQERISTMKKLRQLERRISLISSWIAGFDMVCDNREDEEPLASLAAMRKTALGVQTELESSRQHYHQRLAKCNWERSIDTALQTGVRQLTEIEGSSDAEIESLTREAELLKSIADREAYTSVLEQDKGGDAAVVQVLLQAHFETVAILNQIMLMDEENAVQAAKSLLGKLINSCSEATSQVIKPDGITVVQAYPPTKLGTPKRKKAAYLMGPSPTKFRPAPPVFEPEQRSVSPIKGSPKRRKAPVVRKNVSFSPKKRSPSKAAKRGVRWRDDTEDGTLAEFQVTPQPIESSPTNSSIELPPPPAFPSFAVVSEEENSSPVPAPPESSLDVKPRSSRFQTGFLSKKNDTSPLAQSPDQPLSDSESNPLQEIPRNRAPHRTSLHLVEHAPSSDASPNGSYASASSEDEKSWTVDQHDARKIRSAMKRNSGGGGGSLAGQRSQRRKSPTSASASGSPPGESAGLFSASHARRMVRGTDRDAEWRAGVLSPRTAPVLKGGAATAAAAAAARRTTLCEGGLREGAISRNGPMRPGVMGGPRNSLVNGAKSAWR